MSPTPLDHDVVAPTFADDRLQAAFARDGYVVVDLLGPAEVAELLELFERLDHPVREGFFASNEVDETAYKVAMTEGVQRVVVPRAAELLPDHRFIGGYFVVKWPGAASEKGPHLDWSLVDESRFRSVSVWIPLVATTEENGALCCIRGSHLVVGESHRGSPDFPTRGEAEEAARQFPSEAVRRLEIAAGQAVVYSHQTIHLSSPNLTDDPRPAVNIAAVPLAADLLHFRMADDGTIERLTVDDRFFEAWVWSEEPPPPSRIDVVERINTLPTSVPTTEPSAEGRADPSEERRWRPPWRRRRP